MRAPRRAPWRLACLVGSALLLHALQAAAEPRPEDKDAVLAAYREGRGLVAAGRYAEGCAAFERAKRLDPTALNLLLSLADCQDKLGHTATAWNQLGEAAALARAAGDARAAEATRRAEALAPRLVRLRIEVPPTSHAPGLVITRNGAPVPDALWGATLPVDPGSLVIRATAPGRRPFETTLDARAEGTTIPLRIPTLAAEIVAAQTNLPHPREAPAEPAFGAQRSAALVAAGLGAVGLGVGTMYGLRALERRDASNDGPCDAGNYCDAEGLALRADALDAAGVSTLAFALGAGALGLGVVLWTTAPDAPDAPPPARAALHAGLGPTPRGAFAYVGGVFR